MTCHEHAGTILHEVQLYVPTHCIRRYTQEPPPHSVRRYLLEVPHVPPWRCLLTMFVGTSREVPDMVHSLEVPPHYVRRYLQGGT